MDHTEIGESRVLRLYQRLEKYPFGKTLFSMAVCRAAPYFSSIKPRVHTLRKAYAEVTMKKRRSVTNHLHTVHAIAMCNLCEYTAGICIESTIPAEKRWIPYEMKVSYLHKAKTNLRAICDLSQAHWDESSIPCEVNVYDTDQRLVMQAIIMMKVSAKKA